jgi:3',5'-cyclic AMP phosphodiesterase CpdA
MDKPPVPRYGIEVRLAHCSDLHLLSLDGARLLDFANKRWIGGLNLLSNRGRHYHTVAFEDMCADFATAGIDHVLCTGDITNLALEQEFRFARERFDRIGIGPTHVTVLPGNHDAYVAAGAQHFAATFAPYFAPDPDWAWPDSGKPGDLEAAWPVVRVRGDLAVIGLSTSLATPWFTAWGRVGERQMGRLREVLADKRLAGKVRVVAIHHPPAGVRAASRIRGLRDYQAFAAALADAGAELVVHGHEHQDLRAELPGRGAGIPVLGVQSGTYEASRPERTGRYRVFEIEGGKVIGHRLRVWHRDRRCFADDPSEARSLAASA